MSLRGNRHKPNLRDQGLASKQKVWAIICASDHLWSWHSFTKKGVFIISAPASEHTPRHSTAVGRPETCRTVRIRTTQRAITLPLVQLARNASVRHAVSPSSILVRRLDPSEKQLELVVELLQPLGEVGIVSLSCSLLVCAAVSERLSAEFESVSWPLEVGGGGDLLLELLVELERLVDFLARFF